MFNTLMDFAEEVESGLFSQPTFTEEAFNLLGTDWLFRNYHNSETVVAVSLSDGREIKAGSVYATGGPWGSNVVLIGPLDALYASAQDWYSKDTRSRMLNEGNENCVAIRFPNPGTYLVYQILSDYYQQGEIHESERIERWLEVSEQGISVQEEEVFPARFWTSTVVETRIKTFHIFSGLRFLSMMEKDRVVTTSYTDHQTQTSSLIKTFYKSPGEIDGPSETYCERQRWKGGQVKLFSHSAYSHEGVLVSEGWSDMRDFYDNYEATVEAIDESVSFPLGTAPAVKVVIIDEFDRKTTKWIHAPTGIVLKTEKYWPSGELFESSALKQYGE